MGVQERIERLPAAARPLARGALALSRTAYRVRHPRTMTVGHDVAITGRLTVAQGTTLVLGDRVRVRGRVRINGGGTIVVGADTLLNGCWIIATTEVAVGERCLVSDCGITDTDFHNLEPELRHQPPGPEVSRPVRIGDNVWIGAHALVLKGTEIGDDSVVGAGSVVRGEVPPRVVVAGNPANVVKKFE